MIFVYSWHKGASYTIDNKDPEHVQISPSDRDHIEELTGNKIETMSTESIKSNLRFIYPD